MYGFIVTVLFILTFFWAVGQFIWNVKVKSQCKCGAATGRWFKLYDEPIRLGARWYAKRSAPRRWDDSDFAKFSKLGREGKYYGEENRPVHNHTRR